jgi:succinyl-CoA synthetase beta subunit
MKKWKGLVNIFGGIMKCDVIASGIVNAPKQFSKAMFCYTKTKQITLQDSVSLCS